jgi:hypothetical protein
MIKNALEYIAKLGQQAVNKKREIFQSPDGKDCFTDTGTLIVPPAPPVLFFSMLEGFAGYINANRDELILAMQTVHVKSPTLVEIYGRVDDKYKLRSIPAQCCPPAATRHKFGEYLDAENFIIWLLSGFVQDESTANALKVVGNLKSEKISTIVDDGVTQITSVRARISKLVEVEIRNPIWLHPYRTFEEISQPSSPFILCLRERGEALPQIALFESSDMSWMNTAVKSIGEKLETLIDDKAIPILI